MSDARRDIRFILGIDPGPGECGWVLFDRDEQRIVRHGNGHNGAMVVSLFGKGTMTLDADLLAIEAFVSYGQRLGPESIRTIESIGDFNTAWMLAQRGPSVKISRPTVKQHLLQTHKGNDADVRAALIERFGPGKDLAIGKKATPGPLHGIRGHEWAALAVAVTVADKWKPLYSHCGASALEDA